MRLQRSEPGAGAEGLLREEATALSSRIADFKRRWKLVVAGHGDRGRRVAANVFDQLARILQRVALFLLLPRRLYCPRIFDYRAA
jgi:hypothetical protein